METSLELHDLEGKVVGKVSLPKVLEGPVESDIVWQAVRMYLANRRQGTADTKTRGEVAGGGKKPWAQKHTGRARHGTIRSPIWRKGGIVFGPHPHSFRYELPKPMRRSALLNSLRARVSEKAVSAIQPLEGLQPKTKVLSQLLRQINKENKEKKILLVVDQSYPLLNRISRNIPYVRVRTASDVTCYDVLAYPQMIVTEAGLKRLEANLS